jgi:hypothetical protein
MTQCSLLRGFRGLPRTVQSISDTSGPDSMSSFLQSLPNGQTSPDTPYLPIIPPNIESLQGLKTVRTANIDHIIDQSIFRTLPDRHKQGIDYLNAPRNRLRVPKRLNDIKGIIQQISQELHNTTVFVSWGADNHAQTTNNIYLIVRMESRSFSHNKINPYRSDSFILSDPSTGRSEGDETNYIATVKKIIKDFDTNMLPPSKSPLTPPPAQQAPCR